MTYIPKPPIRKTCKECGERLYIQRSTKQFCDAICRRRHFMKGKAKQKLTETSGRA